MTHFYGHFESLLKDYVVQPWPVDMNASDEQWRFGQVARLWNKIHEPGSPEWKAYLAEHLKLGTVFDPTLTIYSAGRDLMKFRNADWHDKYTLPSLMDFYAPSRANHGAYWYLLDDRRRGRVAELLPGVVQAGERLQEDGRPRDDRLRLGLHLSDLRLRLRQRARDAAGSRLPSARGDSGRDDERRHHAGRAERQGAEFGIVRAGMLADMVIVDQNPLQNFKVLYGTGALKLNDKTGKPEQVGGVKYTIKDGIVYDAKQLLADVAAMVEKQKRAPRTSPAQQ